MSPEEYLSTISNFNHLMSPEEYLSTISNFNRKSDYDKIRLLAYYITEVSPDPLSSFIFSNINSLFEELSIKKPKNLSSKFYNLVASGEFLPTNVISYHNTTTEYKLNRELKIKLLKNAAKNNNKRFEKAYPPRSPYSFYEDVRSILEDGQNILLIEPYFSKEFFALYTDSIKGKKLLVLISLVDSHRQKLFNEVKEVLKKFKNEYGLECRENNQIHDRIFFVDNKCFVTGHSIDKGGDKASYLIELEYANKDLEKIYELLWNSSKKIFE